MAKTQTASALAPITITPPKLETPRDGDLPADALLPARGEEVWVDHPIFTRDKMLAHAVIGTSFDLVMEKKNGGDPEEIAEIDAWLHGRIPIPLHQLDSLLQTRAFLAIGDGIAFCDLPPVRSPANSKDLLFDSVVLPDIAEPHYAGCDPNAPLPAGSEDVWVDHPQFQRCPLFATEIAERRDEEDVDPADLEWLEGRQPIPAETLDELIKTRAEDAAYLGLKVEPARVAA